MSSTSPEKKLSGFTTILPQLTSNHQYKTTKRDIMKYVIHSLAIVAAMSVYGCSISRGVVTPMIERRAEAYFGDDASLWPTIFHAGHAAYGNLIVAPQWPGDGDLFFVDTAALSFPVLQSPFFHNALSFYFATALMSIGYLTSLKEPRQGVAAVVFLLLALSVGVYMGGVRTKYETIWGNDGHKESEEAKPLFGMYVGMIMPFLLVLPNVAVGVAGAKRKCVFMCKIFAVSMLRAGLDPAYNAFVRKPFFQASRYEKKQPRPTPPPTPPPPPSTSPCSLPRSSSMFAKILYRSVGHSAFMYFDIEVYW